FNFPIKTKIQGTSFTVDPTITYVPSQGATIRTNDYISFTFSGVFSQIGSMSLTFSEDATGFLVESNSSNNSASSKVNVVGYNLTVEPIKIWPPSPTIGQTCYIQVKVKNNSSYNLYTNDGLDIIKAFPDFSAANSS